MLNVVQNNIDFMASNEYQDVNYASGSCCSCSCSCSSCCCCSAAAVEEE